MVSCDDFTYPNPPAQSNPQEPVFEASALVLTSVAASDVNLIQANAANQPVALAELTSIDGLPEGYSLSFAGQMAANEDFGGAKDFAVAYDGKTITATADNLDAAYHEALSTIAPSAKTVYIRFKAYAESETAGVPAMRLGGTDVYFGNVTTSMTPFAPDFVIEDSYYLIYSDDAETWTKDHAVKFNHSDASPYDDPSFSVICDFTEAQLGDGLFWKVIPQTTYDSFDLANGLVIGVAEEDSESRNGKLVEGADQLAGMFDIAGPALFEVNMRALTFSYKQAIENFWLAGDDVNGKNWSFDGADPVMWTNDYVNYYGFARLGSEFKFSPQPAWSGDFGSDGGLEFKEEDGEYVGTGVATGSKNINVGKPGVYYISLNYANKDLRLTLIESFGIIGSFNDWGASAVMTASEDGLTYTITQELEAGS